jgi:Xaa-Pro aminopeptidase
MLDSGLDALCVSSGSDLPYLTGYRAHDSERMTMLVVDADAKATLLVPLLEAPRIAPVADAFTVHPWAETDDPIAIAGALLSGADRAAIGSQTWSGFTLGLQAVDESRAWVDAEDLMSGLRIIKSAEEIQALRVAASTVDSVVDTFDEVEFKGRTEQEVAREISERTLAAGHDSVEFCVVASGPHGASPHHTPDGRLIQEGDAIVIDFGGRERGYCSDTTRMVVVGHAPAGFDKAYAVLEEAHRTARDFAKPGVTTSAVDAHARAVIDRAGYGDRFIHRLGHGIGMDVHERPYLVHGDETMIESGMAFSIEPGIYTPGEWGMRIEDIVVATDVGIENLNTSHRRIRVVS